jgi:hypothetical protein
MASTAMQATISVDILHKTTKTVFRFGTDQYIIKSRMSLAPISSNKAENNQKHEEHLTPGLTSSKHPTGWAQAYP